MNREIFTSLFWLLFALYISIGSYHLGLGKWGMPGPGYFPFGASLLMGIISLWTLIYAFQRVRSKEIAIGSAERSNYKSIVLILAAMVGYFLLLSRMGFILCTLLFGVFFLRVVMSQRWLIALMVSFSITLGLHLLFNILLNAQLPKGILKSLGI